MSANNEILIKKMKNKKWRVIHNDLDCGPHETIGDFKTLEKASTEANKFIERCEEEGYGVEYGIRILS